MSWINNRQPAIGQPLPPANPQTAAAAMPQSGSMGYSGVIDGGAVQQQQQGWQPQQQQQQSHMYSHQTPQNNNLYNAYTPLNQNNRNIPQQSWQPQTQFNSQQHQQKLPQMNNQYFNKQNPVVDSYMQQNLMTTPISNANNLQQYQQQSPNQNYFYTQNVNGSANDSIASNQPSFLKTDMQTMDGMAAAQPNVNQVKNEGWDDWEWNDNNQTIQSDVLSQQAPIQQQHSTPNVSSQNVIADSFSTEQTDSWNWSMDGTKNLNAQQPNENMQSQFISHEQQNVYGYSSLGTISNSSHDDSSKSIRPSSVGLAATSFVQNAGFVQSVIQPPQFSAQQTQQTLQQPLAVSQQLPLPSQQIVTSVPTQMPQVSVQQSQPTSSIQTNVATDGLGTPVSSNVYVSQAKPVSQPARQYAMTPSMAGQTTPPHIINNETETALSPSPATSAPSLPPPPPINQTPPPPSSSSSAGSNPYKRAGVAQHHRVALTPVSNIQPVAMQSPFLGPVEDTQHNQQTSGGNQEYLAPDNSEVIPDNKSYEVENLEVAPGNDRNQYLESTPNNDRNQYQEPTPSNDRNQYLQTDHLSEERYNNVELTSESYEQDNFPPPGLSRLVLGQPEIENLESNSMSQNEIPPGLDRMVPGTELVTAGINMERQADGQDTIPAPRSAFSNVPSMIADNSLENIDITDRNLYLVPGESDANEQRIVTGLENGPSPATTEHREVELDGENLEDQQQLQQQLLLQQQQQHHEQQHFDDDIEITREEPIEGANTLDSLPSPTGNQETESSLTVETNQKDVSNASTGNDDSDHKGRTYYGKSSLRKSEDKRRVTSDTKKRKERYETESDYYSSDRDRKFREGSVRGDRERDKNSKERDRRDRREGSARDQDRYRDEKDGRDNKKYDRERQRGKHDRDRDRDKDRERERGSRYNNNSSSRYEADSKYETETSTRYDRRRGGDRDRGDRDRDRYDYDYRRDEKEKRQRRGGGGGGDRYDREDRDRRRDNDRDYRDRRRGDTRGDRGRPGGSSNEYDDDSYSRRTASSRNARDTDRDYKDRQTRDIKDPRYTANMYGYPAGYGYDAYTYYQHQQYFEQLRRTNPQAYAEWYRKYYAQLQTDAIAKDGRESVHSGRSSANNDKERYSYHQHQYYDQLSNDFQQQLQHQHYMHPPSITSSLNSTVIGERSFNLNGGSSTGNLSQYNLQQLQQQFSGVGYPNVSSARSYCSQNDYLETRSDPFNASLNLIDGASTSQEQQRLTPCKFMSEHSITHLPNGMMVCVKPKYSSNQVTNVVKVWKFAPNDSTKRLFNSFPGPLVRGITHKKTIIEFCEDQIRLGPSTLLRSRNNSASSICSVGNVNRASFNLMWALLILLLRQNGMVVGTDIAELLLKNKNQFPYETTSSHSNVAKSANTSRRNSVQSDQKKSRENRSSPSDDENVDSIEDKNNETEESISHKSLSEEDITEKFRNYLLYGNVNEALEWATDNNLWGHALFLASKVDRRLHTNVMMKFANKLSLNDPLQTLYQLMSGRAPSSVTSVQDEKWGDWRPHLAMILSNTSPRPDLDRKAITTLGDSLYNRGDLFSAQFCYLMAQVGFGRYSSVNQESSLMSNSPNVVRLVLLGSSHHKTFKEFASNEAIIMTEIYEYACALNDDKFSIVEIQPYKYLLALRMLDYGMQMKTLMYMEQIARHIQLDPLKYDTSFIQKVYTLSDRLKFVDPMLEKSIDDGENFESNQPEDQPWLQSLRLILSDSNAYETQQVTDIPTRTQIDQQFSEINQKFSALSMQYDNYESNAEQHQLQQQQSHTSTQSQNQNDSNYQMQYQRQASIGGMESGPQSTDQYGQYYNPGQQQMPEQENATSDYDSYGPQSYDQQPNFAQDQYQQMSSLQNQQHEQQNYGYWDQQTQQNEPSGQNPTDQSTATPTTSPLTTSTSMPDTSSAHCTSNSASPVSNNLIIHSKANITPTFDTIAESNKTKLTNSLGTASSHQKSLETKRSPHKLGSVNSINKDVGDSVREDRNNQLTLPPPPPATSTPLASKNSSFNDRDTSTQSTEDTSRPQISMPNTIANKSGLYEDTNDIKSTTGPITGKPIETANKKSSGKAENKKPSNGSSSATNSGWFGGIWNKLSLKPKNQMILPDDKNPTILWDSDKKRWINTDGDEAESESFRPPPKMADIVQNAYNANIGNDMAQNNQQMRQPPMQQHQQPPQMQQQHQQPPQMQQYQQQQTNYGPPDVPMMSNTSNTTQPSTSPGLISSATSNSMSASGNAPSSTGNGGEPMKTPSLQSNMFKMQRNRTLKKSYVDVFNPSGAPTKPIEPVLAPMMPSAAVPQGGIFVPAPIANDNGGVQHNSQEQGVPQFYDPNQFNSYQQQ